MNVCFRNVNTNKLSVMVSELVDEQEAILEVKKHLVDTGEGYNEPVLALIQGGKQ